MATSKASVSGGINNPYVYSNPSIIGKSVRGNDVIEPAGIDVEGYVQGDKGADPLDGKLSKYASKVSLAPSEQLTSDPGKIETMPKKSMEEIITNKYEEESKARAATAAAGFVFDVLNAQSAYNAAKGQAAQNIFMARMQHADTLFLGRQAQLQAQSEGYNAGQDASLQMAAQGQDLQGAGFQKVQGSYEAMGMENGMRAYNNAIREALGYEIEEINTNAQLDSARIARNYSIIGSGLTHGTQIGLAYM